MLDDGQPTRKVSVADLVASRHDACLWTAGGGSEMSTLHPQSSLLTAIVKLSCEVSLDLLAGFNRSATNIKNH